MIQRRRFNSLVKLHDLNHYHRRLEILSAAVWYLVRILRKRDGEQRTRASCQDVYRTLNEQELEHWKVDLEYSQWLGRNLAQRPSTITRRPGEGKIKPIPRRKVVFVKESGKCIQFRGKQFKSKNCLWWSQYETSSVNPGWKAGLTTGEIGGLTTNFGFEWRCYTDNNFPVFMLSGDWMTVELAVLSTSLASRYFPWRN